jgi:hypothetical protein
MIIIKESTNEKEDKERKERTALSAQLTAIEYVSKARRSFFRISRTAPEEYLLLYCNMMLEISKELDLIAKSNPSNDFIKRTSKEISSYALKKLKELPFPI